MAAQHQQPQGKPDHMEHRFDDPRHTAKAFDDPARDAWQMPGRVIEALESRADGRVGRGHRRRHRLLQRAALRRRSRRGTVYAVDVEATMLEHIRKRASRFEHLDEHRDRAGGGRFAEASQGR